MRSNEYKKLIKNEYTTIKNPKNNTVHDITVHEAMQEYGRLRTKEMGVDVHLAITAPPIEERNVSKDCIIRYENGMQAISRFRKWENGTVEWDGSPSVFGRVMCWAFLPELI